MLLFKMCIIVCLLVPRLWPACWAGVERCAEGRAMSVWESTEMCYPIIAESAESPLLLSDFVTLYAPVSSQFVHAACGREFQIVSCFKQFNHYCSFEQYKYLMKTLFLICYCLLLVMLLLFVDAFKYRALAGPESPWICVWRSSKVLELDFLKRFDRTSDCYHQMRFVGSNATEMC